MTYDDVLRKNGHFVGGGALQSARNANTLRWKNGKLSMTDGPYAETKEQLGGDLWARSQGLNHAVQLMSKQPGVKGLGWANLERPGCGHSHEADDPSVANEKARHHPAQLKR